MTISNVALTNTFDEWRVATNQTIGAINVLQEGNSNVNFLTANAAVVGGINVATTLTASFGHANAAYAKANTANTTADLAFAQANTANTTSVAAFAQANTANTTSVAAFAHANAAFASSNTKASNTNTNIFIGAQKGSITTLAASANVFTPDFSANNFFTIQLANNETLANGTSTVVGQSGAFFIKQAVAGSKTLSFGLAYKFPGNTAPTITATANSIDMIVYTVRTANSYICDTVQDVGNTNDT